MEFSLYEITNAFPALMEAEDVDNKEEIEKELMALLSQKSQSVIGYVRNIELTINAMKTEEERIATQRKFLENRIERFKSYVMESMQRGGFTKIETELGTLTLADCPMSVEIFNEYEVPNEFKQELITTKISKDLIKKHIKETGEIIPGVKVIDNKKSLRIR